LLVYARNYGRFLAVYTSNSTAFFLAIIPAVFGQLSTVICADCSDLSDRRSLADFGDNIIRICVVIHHKEAGSVHVVGTGG
jgi:hypothetical protein